MILYVPEFKLAHMSSKLTTLMIKITKTAINVTDVDVNLNVHEIGILLSALQELNNAQENRIAREYGSCPALYNKLYSVYEQMDKSQIGIQYDFTPSY